MIEKRAAAGAAKRWLHVLPVWTPVSDQGALSSCGANAVCDAFEICMGKCAVQLSRLFCYYNARLRVGDQCTDGGSFIRENCGACTSVGLPLEDMWPYDESKVNERPLTIAYEAAYDHKIRGYYRITSTFKDRIWDVKLALDAGHPVVAGFEIGEPFVEYTGGDLIFYPPGRSIGRHAMIIMGYRIVALEEGVALPDNDTELEVMIETKKLRIDFLLRSSWGEDWGCAYPIPIDQLPPGALCARGGHAWATSEWISDVTTDDAWVIVSYSYEEAIG